MTKTNDELPFPRRFRCDPSTAQVMEGADVEDKIVLITGGSSGIGAATVEAFAKKGANVIFTGRSKESAENVIKTVKITTPYAKVQFMPLDLCSLTDVRRFAQEFSSKYSRLDILIFNAGMFGGVSHVVTRDGYEVAFQVDVLSQLYLLNLLEPLVLKSTPARLVFVSSESHRQNTLSLDTLSPDILSPPSGSFPWRQYANSKFCQILLSDYLQRKWAPLGVSCYSLHPGSLIATNIVRDFWLGGLVAWMSKPFAKTLDQGAATTVYCAAAKELAEAGGHYWNHCWISKPGPYRGDKVQMEDAVWNICQEMIKAKIVD